MATAGNLSVQGAPAAPAMAAAVSPVTAPVAAPAAPTSVAAGFTSTAEALHGIKFSYSMQKDAYADYEFLNDVGSLAQDWPKSRIDMCSDIMSYSILMSIKVYCGISMY